jgi:TetR/AcrR family transcriptional regulator, regulator of cefoperazone and chloramphenicol sensitivity
MPSGPERTRQAIVKAALRLFAEKGYRGTSVRDIVEKARVNQAAINYHFKGKDALYLHVLETAFEKLKVHSGFDPEKLTSLPPEDAVRAFVDQQLRPLGFRDELSLYIRMFAWEAGHPTKVFSKFIGSSTSSYITAAVGLVQRFLTPGTDRRVAVYGAIWLMGQCSTFVRNRELLAQDPFRLSSEDVEGLTELISRLALGGLRSISAPTVSPAVHKP